jgi:hypothetical protein
VIAVCSSSNKVEEAKRRIGVAAAPRSPAPGRADCRIGGGRFVRGQYDKVVEAPSRGGGGEGNLNPL